MNDNLDLLIKWTNIKIVSKKKCNLCWDNFIFTDLEKKILDKEWFKETEHCPLCNFKFLYSYINDRNLYKRIDSKTWKEIISIYSSDYKGQVYNTEDYKKFILDDGWLKFWKEIWKDIFEDFIWIYNNFPKQSRLVYPSVENSDYTSHIWRIKNAYMSYCVFSDCENIFFSYRVILACTNVYSSVNIVKSSNVYFSNTVWWSYNISFCDNLYKCSDLLFCEYMKNSSDCIFCCNLVNSKYMIFNKKYDKNKYEEIKKDIYKRINNKEQFSFLKQKYNDFLKENLVKPLKDMNLCENVVWEKTYDSKNCINTFTCSWLENWVNWMTVWWKGNDHLVNIISSSEWWINCENIVWTFSFWPNIYNIFFSFWVIEGSKNIYYSYDIESSEEIMFCVWLKNKKYCILNKQYSKEEYFFLKTKIIEDLKKQNKWGDSLPLKISVFPYNDTLSFDLFKINKLIDKAWNEEIIDENATGTVTLLWTHYISNAILDFWSWEKFKIKWRTRNKNINIPDWIEKIKSDSLPNIDAVNDDILKKSIECEKTWRLFKIVKNELDFLRKKNLPLPTIHNENRIEKLLRIRPTWKLYIWECDKCKKESLTVYKVKPKYKLYCDSCYKDYMYK
jgi:hypothetical protein